MNGDSVGQYNKPLRVVQLVMRCFDKPQFVVSG